MSLVESKVVVTEEEVEWTEGNQVKSGLAKVTTRLYPCREQVLKRREWKKFGEVKNTPRGTHHRGDYLLEDYLKIQTI